MPGFDTRPYWVHSNPDPVNEPVEPRPSAGPCEGRCNSGWRREMRDYDKAVAAWAARGCTGAEPSPPETEPWPGDPVFCPRDTAIIRSALRELPQAYDALAGVMFLTRTASADEERRGRSDVPPSPSPGADHQDAIVRLACAWEDDLRQHLRHKAATDEFGDPRATLNAAVEYLNINYTAMIERWECGGDFGLEVSAAHRTAVAMVKNKSGRKLLPAPCPSCEMTALVQEEGVARKPWYVECSERLGGCGRLFTENEWSWLVQLLSGGHVEPAAAA
jgi:hypothetical protein